MHRYSVELVISGDDLDEAEVSALLGLKASVFFKKGDPLSPKQKAEAHLLLVFFHHSARRGT
jgi:hypothetical protein